MHVNDRRGVRLHVERRADPARRQHPGQVAVDLADLAVGARHGHAVAGGGSRRGADEVVALVGGDHEQRVGLGDPGRGQVRKEGPEGGILHAQLALVGGAARAQAGPGGPVVVHVGQVGEGDRDAVRLQVQGVGQPHRADQPVVPGEPDVAGRILDHVPVQVAHRAGRADHRLDELVAEQRLVARIPARLVGQQVGHPAVGADRRPVRAVHGQAHEVGLGLVRQLGVLGLLGLGRVGPVDQRDVRQGVLQLGVGRRHRAEVAARPGVGHPRRRGVLALRGDQRVVAVADRGAGRGVVVHDRVGPVRERAGRVGGPARRVVVVLVRDRHALVAAVQAGLGGHDVVGRMRDQRRVLAGDQRPVAGDEVQQVRHLLQVAGHVRVVPGVVHVVELDVDDVLDRRPVGAQRAGRGGRRRRTPQSGQGGQGGQRGGRGGRAPGGTASMPSARVPPPTTASSPADRRARRATGVLRRARPVGPFVSLVAAMGDYLHLHRTMGAKES